MHTVDSVRELLIEMKAAAEAVDFSVETFGHIEDWPLLGMHREGRLHGARRIYLSAGIHGDEPAGPQTLLELLQADALPREHTFILCPVLNPYGLSKGIRENASGIDLNRDYRDFVSPEIQSHHRWIEAARIQKLDLSVHLHEDWESAGFYLYELNFSHLPSYADQILRATAAYIPVETATEIDGRPACNGIIRPATLSEIEEGNPEAIYFQQKFGGLNYTLETPSAAPLEKRVDALKAAVITLL